MIDAVERDEGPCALLVDDDPDVLQSLARGLRRHAFSVYTGSCLEDARRLSTALRFDVAVLDLLMPDGTCYELLPLLRKQQPWSSIVVLTGHGSIAAAVEAVRLGATNFLLKPTGIDELVAALRGAGAPDERTPPVDGDTLVRAEWEHLHRVLARSGGNVSEAARRLGIHRRSLQRKLRKHPPRS